MASTNFINECKNRANGNRLGKIIVDSQEITNSDNLQNFNIDSGCYVDGNIIGSVYAKCLKGQFLAVPDNVDLINKNVDAQIGVKYDDTTTEHIGVGKYTIERPKDEITANMSQITAYDSLYTNLDSKYICNIDYSTGNKTVSDLYADVCNQLELTPVSTTFINSTIQITDNPFTNGEKNRTVLQTVAKIASSFIDIDNNTDKIDLCWLSQSEEPDYVFYKNDYESVEGGKIVCGPINCLVIKNSQIDDENVTIKDDESIALYGEHSITISDDYVLYNAELRQQAINTIWNRVHGMTYVDCKLTTYYGKPFLKLGDKIRIYTSETDYFDTYVLKHQFTYDGTFTSVIESPALTEQEIKTKQDVGLQEALRNTQIKVNKQQGEIELLVEEIKQSGIPRYPEAPANPNEEDIYLNTTENIIYVYKDGKWNATSIDPSTLEDYWTKEETATKIEQTSEQINISVTNNQEDIETLKNETSDLKQTADALQLNISKVGGLNLLENSSFQNKFNKWLNTSKKPLIIGETIPQGECIYWYNTKEQSTVDGILLSVGMYICYYNTSIGLWQYYKSNKTKEEILTMFEKPLTSNVIEILNSISNYGLNITSKKTMFDNLYERELNVTHIPFNIKNTNKLYFSIRGFGNIDYGYIHVKLLLLSGKYEEYGNDTNSYETIDSHILKEYDLEINELSDDYSKNTLEIDIDPLINYSEATVQIELMNKKVTNIPNLEWRSNVAGELAITYNDDITKNVYKSLFKNVHVTYIESENDPEEPKEEIFWYDVINSKMKRYVYYLVKVGATAEWIGEWEDTDVTKEQIEKGYQISIFDRWMLTPKTSLDFDTSQIGGNYLLFDGVVNVFEIMLSNENLEWQPASGENFWGKNFKFSGDGLNIENQITGYSRIIDEDEDTAKNNNGTITWQLTPNGALIQDLEVKGNATQGRIITVSHDDGNDYYYV